MFSFRLLALFIHVVSVIVALGGSLFSTFALTPVLAQELEPPMRIRVVRRVIRRLGTIVLTALGALVATGFVNTMYVGFSALLGFKLLLVVVVFLLAFYQYLFLGARIWRRSATGPNPEVAELLPRFRRVGLTVGTLVLLIVYLSLGLTRTSSFALVGVG